MLNSRRALAATGFLVGLFLLSRSHDTSALTVAKTATSTPGAAAFAASPDVPRPVLASSPQKPMVDMSRLSTYEKLAYAFPYDLESKFPAYVRQTWKTTPADESFEFREQESSWTQQHPGFVHQVVSDKIADSLISLLYASIPEVLVAYRSLPLPVLKADFFRYLILLARGGIYSDIDTWALKSALDWIPAKMPRKIIGLVIGIEADPDRSDWADWYSRRIQFCQWTIQSKPGHPVLRDIVARITNQTMVLKNAGKVSNSPARNVIEFTGSGMWTDTIMDYFNDELYFDKNNNAGKVDWYNFTGMYTSKRVGDIAVLPISSFSPRVEQMGSKDYDDPMAFVRHEFEAGELAAYWRNQRSQAGGVMT